MIRSLSLYTFNWAYSKEDGEEGWFSDRVKGRDGIKPERKGKTSGCCLANPCMEKKKTADVFRSKTEKRQKQTDKTKQFTSLGSEFRFAGPYASLLDSCRFFLLPVVLPFCFVLTDWLTREGALLLYTDPTGISLDVDQDPCIPEELTTSHWNISILVRTNRTIEMSRRGSQVAAPSSESYPPGNQSISHSAKPPARSRRRDARGTAKAENRYRA